MNKQELIDAVAASTGKSKAEAAAFLTPRPMPSRPRSRPATR